MTGVLMVLLSTTAWLGDVPSVATLWARLLLLKMSLVLLYALPAIALWPAPIQGWLLLISGWARRAAFSWAVWPPFASSFLETTALRASRFASLLPYRLFAWFTHGFALSAHGGAPIHLAAQLGPGRFLASPGPWIGLGVAAIVLATAARRAGQQRHEQDG